MTPKYLLTSIGHVQIPRRYYACRSCRAKQTPWDEWSGIDSVQVTPHARQVITTVATAWSFDRASQKLKNLCHMGVSDDTIERVCQHEGEQARRWLRVTEPTAQAFKKASGDPEMYSDGLKVNTTGGWREMRLNLLQKRERGAAAATEQWRDRVLPEASMRLASCAIADCRLVGAMWQRWSEQMGLEDSPQLSVIADGAPWIWEQARLRLSPHASWCVDIYHVSEALHACARAIHGEGESARSWAGTELEELIRLGGPRHVERLNQMIAKTTAPEQLAALSALRVYLEGNRDRMWYAQRLAQGQPIGSDAIEGACKKSVPG
ncbi:MAG TPA: hypothetical protein VHD56_04420 [Tepidisphaeraceae bacterium]|nr:hypothetical protein [Tepidisphaeraceae bacterium]